MRTPRFLQVSDGDTLHVYWQCTDHHNQYLLERAESKDYLLAAMRAAKDRYKVTIYDYALMDNHEHLLIKIDTVKKFSRFLQSINTGFALHINKIKERTGAVVRNRCQVSVINPEDKGDMLKCQIYFHLNRWKCEAHTLPDDFTHSGYGFYALGKQNALLTPSPEWLKLADNNEDRQAIYAQKVRESMEKHLAEQTREAIEKLDAAPKYIGNPTYVQLRTAKLLEDMKLHRKKLREALRDADKADGIPPRQLKKAGAATTQLDVPPAGSVREKN